MDKNFACANCSQVTDQCCLCAKLYLCSRCFIPHSSKGGSHRLVQASSLVKTISTIDIEKFKEAMKGMKSRLEAEKQNAKINLDRDLIEKSQKLREDHEFLQQNIMWFYNKSVDEITQVQTTFTNWLENKCELTEECFAMIRIGYHYKVDLEVLSRSLYDLGPVQLAAPQVPLTEHISSFLERINIGCGCRDCIKTAHSLLQGQEWKCTQCGSDLNTGHQCRRCSAVKMEQVAPSFQAQAVRPYSAQMDLRPVDEYYMNVDQRQSVHLSLIKDPEASNAKWKCKRCRYRDNSSDVTNCARCKAQRIISKTDWICYECGKSCRFDKANCTRCNMRNMDWENYLVWKGVELSSDYLKWRCGSCHKLTSIEKYECCNCRRMNSIIAKGLQAQGNKIYLSEKVVRVFGQLKQRVNRYFS